MTDLTSDVAGLASGLAGRIVSRLSQSFQRVVPSAAPVQARQAQARRGRRRAPRPADQSARVEPQPFSPFQFRLPPPLA